MSTAPALPIPDQLAAFAGDLRRAVQERAREPQPMLALLQLAFAVFARIGYRISLHVIDRFRAGTLAPPRPRKSRAGQARPERAVPAKPCPRAPTGAAGCCRR